MGGNSTATSIPRQWSTTWGGVPSVTRVGSEQQMRANATIFGLADIHYPIKSRTADFQCSGLARQASRKYWRALGSARSRRHAPTKYSAAARSAVAVADRTATI